MFELTLDQESIAHLGETARWGKFLAIAGFVTCGLMVVLAFVVGSILAASSAFLPPEAGRGAAAAAFAPIGGALIGAIYLVFAGIYFFPCLFLFRFSVRMKTALKGHDLVQLNQSLKAQRNLFRFVGILTIIGLALGAIEVLAVAVIAIIGLSTK